MNTIKFLIPIIIAFSPVTYSAEKMNTESSVKTWEKVEQGVTFSLKQILPDQVKAFYIGRGFTITQIKPYTETCVYSTILRNDNAPGRLHFIRHNWNVVCKGKSQKLKKSSDWLAQLNQQDIKPSALIAFRFAQFPAEQEYEPNGDWNQGMLSVNLPIGSQFDITVRWDIAGKPYELTLQDINCIEQI